MGRPGVIPVFVGNISFDTTEEMVRDVFAEVGPVVAVRLVNSKDSGKPKGYGFVEFADMATAESAVRNLNGRELAGRALRVDFAEHPDGSRVVVGTRRGALSASELLSVGVLIPTATSGADGIRTAPPSAVVGAWGTTAAVRCKTFACFRCAQTSRPAALWLACGAGCRCCDGGSVWRAVPCRARRCCARRACRPAYVAAV